MTSEGVIFRTHDLTEPPVSHGFVATGDECVRVTGESSVSFFDAVGEPLISVDAGDFRSSIARRQRLYVGCRSLGRAPTSGHRLRHPDSKSASTTIRPSLQSS